MTVWALYGFEKTTDITDAFPAVKGVVEAVRARPQCAPLLDAFEAEVISFLEAELTDAFPPHARLSVKTHPILTPSESRRNR